MSTVVLAFVAVILCVLFRILNVNSAPLKPLIIGRDTSFRETILKVAPLLNETYIPPRLWGFSGHVQTIVHSAIGRLKCPLPLGHRTVLTLPDGSNLSYDTYHPNASFEDPKKVPLPPRKRIILCLEDESSLIYDVFEPRLGVGDDVTIAVCPGIGNTSETIYIRTFVYYAQYHGYRIAVLNHLGALKTVRLTAPRIFSYGHTDDYHAMLSDLVRRYPHTKILALGYSLGGNLVTKYMGENRERPSNIFAAISVCQGYSAIDGTKCLLDWQNFRRLYLYVITEAVRNIVLKHRYILLSEATKKQLQLNEREIIAAATLPELDDVFTRRMYKFKTVEEMYRWSSSSLYIPNIKTPMIFINAKDDPLIPEELWTPARSFCNANDKALFISLTHGGHLGFFEGGLIFPNPVSWLDRALMGIVGGLVLSHSSFKK